MLFAAPGNLQGSAASCNTTAYTTLPARDTAITVVLKASHITLISMYSKPPASVPTMLCADIYPGSRTTASAWLQYLIASCCCEGPGLAIAALRRRLFGSWQGRAPPSKPPCQAAALHRAAADRGLKMSACWVHAGLGCAGVCCAALCCSDAAPSTWLAPLAPHSMAQLVGQCRKQMQWHQLHRTTYSTPTVLAHTGPNLLTTPGTHHQQA